VKDRALSRRAFLGTSAITLTVVPRHVLGGEAKPAPSDKLNVAGIGVGGKGTSDVGGCASENIVALCDADERRGAGSFRRFPKARKFRDYRKMFDQMEKQIDAVTVSTPDHTHYPASMMAIQRGMHCFTQKPLTHSIWEARQLAEAARKHKVATVMGIQGHCREDKRFLCEWLWAGKIGQVREEHIWTNRPIWPQGIERPTYVPPIPKGVDWDCWLGPAPDRPYGDVYLPFKWRGWWDFGTGALGDIACHAFDGVFWALKLGEAKTFAVAAETSPYNDETYPNWSIITYEFPARGALAPLKLVWYDGGKKPPRPEALEKDRKLGSGGQILIGDKGTMLGNRVVPEATMRAMLKDKPPETLPRSPGVYQELIRAAKGGEKCGANFPDFAGPLTEVVLAGNLAIRTKTKTEWDVAAMRSPNVPEANQHVRREYRKGWDV